MGLPLNRIDPRDGRIRPDMVFSNVLFSGAVRPEDRDHFPRIHFQRDISQGRESPMEHMYRFNLKQHTGLPDMH